MKYLLALVAVVVGVAAVVAGGADDSPGLQLIGVLIVAASAALLVRSVRSVRRAAGARVPGAGPGSVG